MRLMLRLWRSDRPRLRLAVDRQRVVAVLPDGAVREIAWESPDELTTGLEALRTAIDDNGPGRRPAADLVVLPPLVDVRRVSLPRLKPYETTALLERHSARYFPAAREPQVIGWRRVGSASASPADLLVAAAPASVLDTLREALEAAGFDPGDPVPAHETWAAATASGNGALAVVGEERVEVLGRRGGCLVDAATVPAPAVGRAAERLVAMAECGPLTLIGAGLAASALNAAVESSEAESAVTHLEEDPAVVAARGARPGGRSNRLLSLVPVHRRAAVERRSRRFARGMWAAAAVLLIAAGLLELWGLGRELEAVRAERTALADRVTEVMAQRDALRGLQGAITALDSLEMTIPVWSGLVTEVARHLPDDAHLAALRGERDSVAIEGVALEAARVFAALRDVPGVSRVVARAPIRREQEGPRAVERFSLAARVRQVEEGGGE